ncbi:MAG: helix-turn-helix transcriptional regulator [Actinomycetota bacterium]
MSGAERDTGGSVFPGFSDVAEDSVELIGRLSELRRSRGLSQTEVAARMGTSQSALARLESGQADVRVSTLARYAAALGADLGFAVRDRGEG